MWTALIPFAGTVARALLAAAGGYVVSKGLADPTSWDSITGAVTVLASTLWGLVTHAKTDVRVPSVAAASKVK